MPTDNDFDPTWTPVFLLADKAEPQEMHDAPGRPAALSRTFMASGLIAAVTVIGAAVLWVEDPVTLLASVTAPLVGSSSRQPGTSDPLPANQLAAETPASIQPAADTQSLAQIAKDAPGQDEIVSPESKAPSSETIEPASEDLFRKFQAWAADKDAQTQAEAAQPVQDAPAPVVKQVAGNVRVPHRLTQRQPRAMPVRNARAEARPPAPRKREKPLQNARPEAQRTSDVRAQELPAQAEQTQSLLPIFGQRN